MVKRLNYTGRIEISLDDTEIKLDSEKDQVFVTAKLDTSTYGFPTEAKIRLHMWHAGVTVEDVDLGTVGEPKPAVKHYLEDFSSKGSTHLAVFVVDPGGNKLLGLLGKTRLALNEDNKDDENQEGILGTRAVDLGHRIWKLAWEDDSVPVIHINNKLNNPYEVVQSPNFVTIVYPEIFRMIVLKQVELEAVSNSANPEWKKYFDDFAVSRDPSFTLEALVEIYNPQNLAELEEKVDEMCAEFSFKHDLLNLYNEENSDENE